MAAVCRRDSGKPLLAADIPEVLTWPGVFYALELPVVHGPVNAPRFLGELRVSGRDRRELPQVLMHAWMHWQIAAEAVGQMGEGFSGAFEEPRQIMQKSVEVGCRLRDESADMLLNGFGCRLYRAARHVHLLPLGARPPRCRAGRGHWCWHKALVMIRPANGPIFIPSKPAIGRQETSDSGHDVLRVVNAGHAQADLPGTLQETDKGTSFMVRRDRLAIKTRNTIRF